MKTRNIIIIVLLLLASVGVGVVAFLWNKPHRTAEDEKPFATLTANDLYMEFSNNEAAAFAKYRDQVIQVTGVVQEIKLEASGNTDVVLATDDILGTVICTLKRGGTADGISAGMTVDLKGICNGFLSDVLLNQGVIVNKK